MRNRRLVSGAKFLAGKAVASPGDSLEARRGNLLVAPFTGAVSAASTTTKRIVDFPQKLTTQTCSDRRHILFGSSDSKLNNIRRLNIGRQRRRRTFCRCEQFGSLLKQQCSITILRSLHSSSHSYLSSNHFGDNPKPLKLYRQR